MNERRWRIDRGDRLSIWVQVGQRQEFRRFEQAARVGMSARVIEWLPLACFVALSIVGIIVAMIPSTAPFVFAGAFGPVMISFAVVCMGPDRS